MLTGLSGNLIADLRNQDCVGLNFHLVMIRKGESMLLQSGRVSLLAALLTFVLAPTSQVIGQEDHAAAAQHDDAAVHSEADHEQADTESSHAAGGHADPAGTPPLLQIDIGSAICNLAIFLGVLAILSKFVWPTILGGLQAREDKIHGDLEAAEKANLDARVIAGRLSVQAGRCLFPGSIDAGVGSQGC